MKNSNSVTTETSKSKQKKTSLDCFQLFFEEIPLELGTKEKRPLPISKDRLARRSKMK